MSKINDATPNRPEGTRMLDGPMVHISLPHYTRQIKAEPAWEKNDRNAITVLHTGQLRIVLVALHEGAEMPPYTADGPLSVQVLEGRLWLETEGQSISLDTGEVVALQDKMVHSIHAEEESVFLMTMAKTHE